VVTDFEVVARGGFTYGFLISFLGVAAHPIEADPLWFIADDFGASGVTLCPHLHRHQT
jgi:hypothetical protein